MNKKLPSVRLVFDRKHQATKSGVKDARKGLVQIEVLHQRKRKYISTGVRVYANQWRQNAEQHIVGSAYAKQYNDTITHALGSVMEAINRQERNGSFDLGALRLVPKDCVSVADYGQNVIPISGISELTAENVKSLLRIFGRFPKFANIRTLTRSDIDAYVSASKLRPTSLRVHLRFLHRIIKHALREGVMDNDPMDGYEMPKGAPRARVRLTEAEVSVIASMALFLMQVYTGMSYVDLATLTPDMIVHEDGKHYIMRARHKTNVQYRTTLLKPAVDIMERYNWQIHVPESHTYNYHLKYISKHSGIKKTITGHVGRHTFATWALSHGTPIEIVSKMLGHTKIETTQIYAKILAKDVDDQFEKLDKLFK